MTTFSRRKALALAGAVALAAGMAAASPALAQDCEKVDLTFTFWGSVNEKNDIETAVKNWNEKNPCIQVRPMHIPATGTNYVQKLTTMIASNTAPDIGYLGESQAFQWAMDGKILDLSPYMGATPDQQYIKSTIYKAGDTLMGTGLATGVMLIYYNKDVFDAAGVPYPPAKADEAWTWQQFVDNAKLLTKDRGGKNPNDPAFDPNAIDTFGVTLPSWWGGWYPYVMSNGGQFANADGTALTLNSPEVGTGAAGIPGPDLQGSRHAEPDPDLQPADRRRADAVAQGGDEHGRHVARHGFLQARHQLGRRRAAKVEDRRDRGAVGAEGDLQPDQAPQGGV